MSEAICLVIDVGAFSAQQPPDGVSFLNSSLECASMFVERKLFSETKDDIGIVLFGTEESNNPQDYDHVTIIKRGFCPADWETIRFLRSHVEGGGKEGDWIDALVVALDCLKRKSEGKKYTALKIVLFSDLGCEANSDQKELIIGGMKLLDNVDFTHIGPRQLVEHVEEDRRGATGQNGTGNHQEDKEPVPGTSRDGPEPAPGKPLTEVQRQNQLVLNEIVESTGGMMCSLEDAVAFFFFKNKKGKKPWPWKVVLEVGPDIKINTTGYVRVRREPPKTWKRCLARGGAEGEELRPQTSLVRNNEEQAPIDREDTVMSYRYGSELVTITDADEAACKFDGGPKSMSLFGFINRSEIRMSDLIGNGSMVFLPQEEDENSERALAALAQAMLELDVVAIVRRVYSRATNPHLAVLAPELDTQGEIYLAYVDLPFMEDRRELQFPSLDNPRRPLTDLHIQAVDDLIDNLDLEAQSADEEGKVVLMLDPGEELNPLYQYLYLALTTRALHPGQPFPAVPSTLLERLSKPGELEERMAPISQRIRDLFPLEQVESRKAKRTGDKVFGMQDQDKESDVPSKKAKLDVEEEEKEEEGEEGRIFSVGSINPVEDFNHILGHSVTTGATIESAGLQMEGVIDRLLASAFGTDLNSKIVKCLEAYREACKNRERPKLYNDFIRNVKQKAGGRLWSDICAAQLGLLVWSGPGDRVSEAEADMFLQAVSAGGAEANQQAEEEEDMLDLL